MTRDWTFTLANVGQWYNLWDLIKADPSFTDPTFSNAPYVPSNVCELKYQNQTPGGSVVTVSDSKKEAGFSLLSGSWDVARSSTNAISLRNYNFQTDTAGTVIYVSIVAL